MTLTVGGETLVGTHHRPDLPTPGGIGFLFLNAGPAPRAGNSDLSARLCDHLAALGFDAFRVDLPGLGDSPGTLPSEVESFWIEVQRGRNVDITLDLARQLRDRFELGALVAGGVCAGAVTCLFAVERAPELIGGLVLLEPNLFAPSAARLRRAQKPPLWKWSRRWHDWGWMSGRWMRLLTGTHPAARRMEPLLPMVMGVAKILAGPSPEVNRLLVVAWRRVLATKVPTFLAVVHQDNQDHFCRCILSEVPRAERKALTELKVQSTNHILTRGNARELVTEAVGRWAAMWKKPLLEYGSRKESESDANPLSLEKAVPPGTRSTVPGERGSDPGERRSLGVPGP
jgi:pimeloyl-ACP methyl ester carboxylesterase